MWTSIFAVLMVVLLFIIIFQLINLNTTLLYLSKQHDGKTFPRSARELINEW